MVRRLFAIVIALLIVGCSAAVPPIHPAPDPFFRSMRSTVMVLQRTERAKYEGVVCAGVAVGRRKILTAAHCIEDASLTPIEVAAASESTFSGLGRVVRFVEWDDQVKAAEAKVDARQRGAFVAGYDPHSDLALLVPDDELPEWTPLRDSYPELGENVYAIGHPGGLVYTLTVGRVSYPLRTLPGSERGKLVQADVSIWFGNSGGGLFDKRGMLVGVCSAKGASPNVGFFVHPLAVRAFLHRVSVSGF